MLIFYAIHSLYGNTQKCYNCIQNKPIFPNFLFLSKFFDALSMSESLAISLVLECKILQSFLFLYSKTSIVWIAKPFQLT